MIASTPAALSRMAAGGGDQTVPSGLCEVVKACQEAINNAATLLERFVADVPRGESRTPDPVTPRARAVGHLTQTPRPVGSLSHQFLENFVRDLHSGSLPSTRRRQARTSAGRAPSRSRGGRSRSTSFGPSWGHSWVCLALKDAKWTPTPRDRAGLREIGLGEKRIRIPLQSSASQVHEILLQEFPKLEEGGGYEICRTHVGSRELNVIPCPPDGYTQSFLSIEAGQARLYIRPLQRDLDTTPTFPEINSSEIISVSTHL